jgi:transcriptional regulator with XRE-family HTH domain
VEKSIGQRLRDSIKVNNMSLKDFSDKTGIPYRTLQQYVADEIFPGGEALKKIHAELGISTDWLLSGEEPMRKEVSEIDKAYKELSEPQQRLVLGIAQQLLSIGEIERKLGMGENRNE